MVIQPRARCGLMPWAGARGRARSTLAGRAVGRGSGSLKGSSPPWTQLLTGDMGLQRRAALHLRGSAGLTAS